MDYKIKGFIVNEIDIQDFLKDIDKYGDLVRKIIWDEICLKFDGLDSELIEIKSPIEQALFLTMQQYIGLLERRVEYVQGVAFIPQHRVVINNKTYYLDFYLGLLLVDGSQINFAIECDGHEFHERTKEQATKDRQRERTLTSEGYTVIRFTGSEIYKDPYKCAEEIYGLTLNKLNRL